MSSLQLLHLAIVSDKYGCVKAINLTLDALFPKEIKGLYASSMRDLVVASYLLDHPSLFWKFTNSIFADYTEPLVEIAFSEMGQRVPALAWCM